MKHLRSVVVLLLALAAPMVAHAGPTLYDMQHSSVLRQRLPPYLRQAADRAEPGKDSSGKAEDPSKGGERKDAASAGSPGTSGSKDAGAKAKRP